MMENISSVYISNNYLGLFSWLIDRAFNITSENKKGSGYRDNKTDNNKAILLQTLYKINSKLLLKCFKNG